MVIGVGLDLVEESRVVRILARWGARFLAKVLAPEEADRLPEDPAERARGLAGTIALKEAASKAIGTGWSQGVRWRDVVTRIEPRPEVRLDARAGAIAGRLGSTGRTRVVLSRQGDLVLAEVWLLS
jgi:holo-[acyl-carrier protein] synthase